MQNQTQYERITRLIVQPLIGLYGGSFNDYQLEALVEDLQKFEDQTLWSAIKILRQSRKHRGLPLIGEVVDACRQAIAEKNQSLPAREGKNPPCEFYAKYEAAVKDACEYTRRFMQTATLAAEARREFWDLHLMNYVYAVAAVQSQMMAGLKSIGWSGVDIFGAGETINSEQKSLFFSDQRRQANIGIIDVPIPTSLIERWKKLGAAQKLQHNNQGVVAA